MPTTGIKTAYTKKTIQKPEAQNKVLGYISEGYTVIEAMAKVQRTEEAYRKWREVDPKFRRAVDEIRAAREQEKKTGRPPLPPFDVFCADFLHEPLYDHQLRMWDVLEGRPPRKMLDVLRYDPTPLTYEPVNYQDMPAGRVIINCPPGFAKTRTITINWITYQIHKNPNVKIVVICKDLGLATDILSAVKFRLTSDLYRDMHLRFAPVGGWRDPDNSWSQTKIRVQGKDDGSHSPTLQALGIGGRIYGTRSDIIIMDDAITLANVNEYVKQQKWLVQEVESRLDGGGLLCLLGTRVASIDLYKTIRELEDWEGNKVFTYFSQPALLSEGDGKIENWVSLWPEWFTAERLSRARRNDEAHWALVFQQQDVAENAAFPSRAVEASINTLRFPGPMTIGVPGHREQGMNGLYVVGGLDPATVGNTAMVVAGLDRETGKRYILDGINRPNMHAQHLIAELQRLTNLYHIQEWVIERNAAQRFITQIPEIQDWLHGRGVKITPHNTNVEKFDSDFGIQAMAQLFLTCGEPPENRPNAIWKKTPDKAMIELPTARQNAWVSALVNQLITWEPTGMTRSEKTDLVMALWFCEIAFKRVINRGKTKVTHEQAPFTTQGRKALRGVVSLRDLREAKNYAKSRLEGVG